MSYNRILSRVPCDIQSVLVGYLFYIYCRMYMLILNSLPGHVSPLVTVKFVFKICETVSVL